jgi:hypothetical protein
VYGSERNKWLDDIALHECEPQRAADVDGNAQMVEIAPDRHGGTPSRELMGAVQLRLVRHPPGVSAVVNTSADIHLQGRNRGVGGNGGAGVLRTKVRPRSAVALDGDD